MWTREQTIQGTIWLEPSWLLPNGTWLIALDSQHTHLIAPGAGFISNGPRIPYALQLACTVMLNASHAFVAGGAYDPYGALMADLHAWEFSAVAAAGNTPR